MNAPGLASRRWLALWITLIGCESESAPLVLGAVTPAVIDPIGHSHLTIGGSGFSAGAGVSGVEVGGVAVTSLEVVSDTELRVVTGPVAPGPSVDLTVLRGDERVVGSGVVEAWSPAQIPGARLFDAAVGIERGAATTGYEWQQLTDDIGPDWRVRDGNTTTWLPSTRRYWMVGGWNGLQEPDGFSSVPPDSVYPPENTSDEVWSSADGVAWRLELSHGHGQFERRHGHNMMLWKDKLWMIGGDHHQGRYNHDVVSSPDGVNWTVELGPGKTPPPWSPRGLQISGVYAGKLWTVGGQELTGVLDTQVIHNDVWNTSDGVHWTQVAADAPASATRWRGCGAVDGLVEFKGRMWLVGCARHRDDAQGHTMYNEVWSTTDGVTWTRHSEPPWKGKIWHNALVWDDRLWILFGYTYGDLEAGWTSGNAREIWHSADGESWTALPIDSPVPGSHAQGVAVTEGALLLAGGNYSFDPTDGFGKSAWRLVPYRGAAVTSWTGRGDDALRVVAPTAANQPLYVPDGLGPGRGGLHFDGSNSVLELGAAGPDAQVGGRSVFWVGRAPHRPEVPGWVDFYNPAGTVVGGAIEDGYPQASVGLSGGRLLYINREDGLDELGSPRWKTVSAGADLQPSIGEVRLVGVTHGADGVVQAWADGVALGPADTAHFGSSRGWSRIGGGLDGAGEGPANRFAGTLGAVVITPGALDAATVARMHAWAQARFGAR
jgi:hypothetical protein